MSGGEYNMGQGLTGSSQAVRQVSSQFDNAYGYTKTCWRGGVLCPRPRHAMCLSHGHAMAMQMMHDGPDELLYHPSHHLTLTQQKAERSNHQSRNQKKKKLKKKPQCTHYTNQLHYHMYK